MSVKKIRIRLDPAVVRTTEEGMLMEVLLEICDTNLDIRATEAEVRELLSMYAEMYRAVPVAGLRELILGDAGVALFFQMFKGQIVPLRRTEARQRQRLEMYKRFNIEASGLLQTPHLRTLRGRVDRELLLSVAYKLMVQSTTPPGKA